MAGSRGTENESTFSVDFRRTAARWIAESGEISALIRYDRAAGSKDFELFTSNQAFEAKLDQLSPRTSIIVFADRQLPLRGRVDNEFITAALEQIPEGEEFMLLELELTVIGGASWYSFTCGESHAELREEMMERTGQAVAVGVYPPWLYDNDRVISAIVPDADGIVRSGCY